MPQVKVPVRPTDPPFLITLAGLHDYSTRNPRRWVQDWKGSSADDMMEVLYDNFHRTDAQGNLCQRVVIEAEKRTPNAIEPMAVATGAGWESFDPFRKQLLIDTVMNRRKEDRDAGRPEVTVGFYVGVIGNGMPGLISNHTANDVLNLDNDRDRNVFDRQWGPWVECGVLSELWHDAGTKVDNRGRPGESDRWPKVKNLLNDQKQWMGLHGGTEAIRWLGRRTVVAGSPYDVVYDWAPYDDVPMWCLSRYILQRDRSNTLEWPDGAEVWIMNSQHVIRPENKSGLLTEEQARDFTRRGWGVSSFSRWRGADKMVNLP